MASRTDLEEALSKLSIETQCADHDAVTTLEAQQNVDLPADVKAGLLKNLFLYNKRGDDFFLVSVLGSREFDLKAITLRLGIQKNPGLKFASAEDLTKHLGVELGSVTPLAAMSDKDKKVTVVLDQDLMSLSKVACHPMVNTSTMALSPGDLVRFLESTSHEPRMLDFSLTLEQVARANAALTGANVKEKKGGDKKDDKGGKGKGGKGKGEKGAGVPAAIQLSGAKPATTPRITFDALLETMVAGLGVSTSEVDQAKRESLWRECEAALNGLQNTAYTNGFLAHQKRQNVNSY